MNPGSTEISDQVTILVFKDNYAARTFQIPLKWISWFGLLLGLCFGMIGVSTFFAIKYYRNLLKADPSQVQNLEQRISDLQATLKGLETRNLEKPLQVSDHTAPPIPALSPAASVAAAPTLQPTAPLLFSALPSTLNSQLPDPKSLPFSIDSLKTSWQGKSLKLRFALQYTKGDDGYQQGHIIVIARGPETLLGYPTGIFNSPESANLISPEHGEFFSVSRYREVNAQFGPLPSRNSIQNLEILIFNSKSELLVDQKIIVSSHGSGRNTSPQATSQGQDAASSPSQPPNPPETQSPGTQSP